MKPVLCLLAIIIGAVLPGCVGALPITDVAELAKTEVTITVITNDNRRFELPEHHVAGDTLQAMGQEFVGDSTVAFEGPIALGSIRYVARNGLTMVGNVLFVGGLCALGVLVLRSNY